MSDPISIASATIALLSQATKAQQKLLKSRNLVEDIRQVNASIQTSFQKYKVWHETWSGQAQHPEITSEALWGTQGWANIRRLLERIMSACEEIQDCLIQIQEKGESRSKWKSAVKSLRSKKRPQSKLKELATILSNATDELWIYSETVFDSLHGVMAQELRLPSRDMLLTSALQSRAGSLALYGLCAKSTLDCSLAMDLLDADSDLLSPSSPSQGHASLSMHLFYQLFTHQALASPKELEKLVVENVPESELLRTDTGDVISANSKELQLFEPKTRTTIIEVAKQGSGPASCLRIPKKPVTKVLLKSRPEKLASILKTLHSTTSLSTSEHFSTGAKIELAYKIVESGFFLLGTPWFSSLSSSSLLRLKSAGRQRHSFILEIQTLDFSDLLFDDPEALTETSQLFRIGILLMEIALNKTNLASPEEENGLGVDTMRLLPEVEKSMGAQYCRATAFCLQHWQPRPRFRGTEKYSTPRFDEWESYLAGFLQDYHSQVFLRLEELREIDTRSEFRSRMSSFRTKSL